jgi:hypothetical protein
MTVCKGCECLFDSVRKRREYCFKCHPVPQPKIVACKTCWRSFTSKCGRIYCDRPDCRRTVAPGVYRFVCLDGRAYVGSSVNVLKRGDKGIGRKNPRLLAAFEQYPPETFTYEVLERLVPGCPVRDLREAEQRHIDLLRSWSPDAGFNMAPARWGEDGPAQRAARQWRADLMREQERRASVA